MYPNEETLIFTSEKAKYSNDYKWFKDYADSILKRTISLGAFPNKVYKNMQVNFDLYNGKLDINDMKKSVFIALNENDEYDIDRNFIHQDVISKKLKVLEGMERTRGFNYSVIAVNEEAITRKQQKKYDLLKQWVVSEIMNGVKQAVAEKYAQDMQQAQQTGNSVMLQQIQQAMQQDIQAMTPPEIDRFMQREYKDPAEILAEQIINYIKHSQDLDNKFNQGWKNSLITGVEVYYVADNENGDIVIEPINPIDFAFGGIPSNTDRIEKAKWAICKYNWTIDDIINKFSLKEKEIRDILKNRVSDVADFFNTDNSTITVFHIVWKAQRKIGFLQYVDSETGEVLERIVDDSYKLKPEYGDIDIQWKWIPEVYEAWRVGYTDVWLKFGVVKQIREYDYITDVDLPYIGMVYDKSKEGPISIIDRMKPLQYMYDLVLNKLRQLMLSDKGRMLLMNIGMIPTSKGWNVEKWLEYARLFGIGFFNPNEPGNRIQDINAAAKQVDMGLISDMEKYIRLLDYLEEKTGDIVGITPQVIGNVAPRDAVRTTQMAINQSIQVLEPYFMKHTWIKKNVVTYALNVARFVFAFSDKQVLQYVLDDLSYNLLKLDLDAKDLMLSSSYGIFISDSYKYNSLLDYIGQITQAAMQNNAIAISDAIKILKAESLEQAIELLEEAEKKQKEYQQQLMQYQMQVQTQEKQAEQQLELDKIKLKGEIEKDIQYMKDQTALAKQVILAEGFNEDKDMNRNSRPDVEDFYDKAIDRLRKLKELELKERQLQLQEQQAVNNIQHSQNSNIQQ